MASPLRETSLLTRTPVAFAWADHLLGTTIPTAIHLLFSFASTASLLLPAVLFQRFALWLSTIERPDGVIAYSPTLRIAVHILASLLGIDFLRVAALHSAIMGAVLTKVKSRRTRKIKVNDTQVEGNCEIDRSETPPCILMDVETFALLDKSIRIDTPHSSVNSISPSPTSSSSSEVSKEPCPTSVSGSSPNTPACPIIASDTESFCSRDAHLPTPLAPSTAALPSFPPNTPFNQLRLFTHGTIRYAPQSSIYSAPYVHVFCALARCLVSLRQTRVVIKVQRAGWDGETEWEIESFLRATKASCPFLVGLRDVWTEGVDTFFVMNPYPDNFHCVTRSRSISSFEKRLYAAELLLALQSLHSARVLHGDIKPGNILLSPLGHLALADFGLSVPGELNKPTGHIRCYVAQGTLGYAAPEAVCQAAETKGWGVEADVWSYGVVLSEMLSEYGQLYFQRETEEETREATLLLPILGIEKYIADPVALDLVLWILHRDPEERPTLREIKHHPFFADIDWKAVKERRYEHTLSRHCQKTGASMRGAVSTDSYIPQKPRSPVDWF